VQLPSKLLRETTGAPPGRKVPVGISATRFDGSADLLVLGPGECTRCDDEMHKGCSIAQRRDAADPRGAALRQVAGGQLVPVVSGPYCLVGCPVDSIHRRGSRESASRNWCIGCGNCANQLPLRQHQHASVQEERPDPVNPAGVWFAEVNKATMCDLCSDLDGQPAVVSCHDAATA